MLNLFKKISLLGVLAAALVAPGAFAASDTPVLDRVLDFKVLKVGMSGNQAPMNINSRSGQIIGYEVDLARALAGAMLRILDDAELASSLSCASLDRIKPLSWSRSASMTLEVYRQSAAAL